MLKKLLEEIRKHSLIYCLLGFILIAAFIIRVYRVNDLLGFYYDQGRDALVIWDLIHGHKFFLIGPTTGLAGIFRGPYYYYLIAPFYFLGRGNPIFPTVFLILTSVVAIGFIYYLGLKIQGRTAGIIAAVISSFSFYVIVASKWLSNPTPMLLTSMILVWAMLKVTEGKRWGWPIISLCIGLSLFNFGSAGELFYVPAVLIFGIWQKKNLPDTKNFVLSILLFIVTFAPLVFFDLKHGHILWNNILQTFVGEKSFIFPTKYLFDNRTPFYYNVFTKLLFDYRGLREQIVFGIIAIWLLVKLPRFIKNSGYIITLLLLISPVLGLYFYQGNNTVLYDYYFTGYFLIFILLVSCIIADFAKNIFGKIFAVIFLVLFLKANLSIILPRLSDNTRNPQAIFFKNQKDSIDWIYKDAGDRDFNVDVYVPPVIPYAYDYLFKWLGTYKYGRVPDTSQVSLLYTLYEVDPPHPERLQAWLDRQRGIGKTLKEQSFGGITVQERERITK